MELSAPSGTPQPPQIRDYVRPSTERIWQLRYQMNAGLAQPLDRHEKYYVELHRYNVLAGRIGDLPSMLRPHPQHRLAIEGPKTEEPLEPIVFPSFNPVDPAAQRRLIQLPAASHSSSSEASTSPSLVSTVNARAARLLRLHGSQPRIEEVKNEEDDDTFAYNIPSLDTEYFTQRAASPQSSLPENAGMSEVIDLTGSPTPERNFFPEQHETAEVHTPHPGIEALFQAADPSPKPSNNGGQQRRRSQRIANLNATANTRRTGTPGFLRSQADVLSQLQDTGSVDTIATLPAGTRIRVRAEVIKDEGISASPEVKTED
ncbi:hypothetical protein SLS58_003998 [Diplodia intermedia]|uniref:Uncharacterized protein n=1 Tax=Diplodia intermedia TaxID=856260 RepID=A0ABR3TUE8_9PEZI